MRARLWRELCMAIGCRDLPVVLPMYVCVQNLCACTQVLLFPSLTFPFSPFYHVCKSFSPWRVLHRVHAFQLLCLCVLGFDMLHDFGCGCCLRKVVCGLVTCARSYRHAVDGVVHRACGNRHHRFIESVFRKVCPRTQRRDALRRTDCVGAT